MNVTKINTSLVKTGWFCISIPILIQFGLFMFELRLTGETERLAQLERQESDANDIVMKANSVITQGWAALILRGARAVPKNDESISRNLAESRNLIAQLKAIPREGSTAPVQTIIDELESQADNLEQTDRKMTEREQEDVGDTSYGPMFERIKKLKKDGTNGIMMLHRMTAASDQHRLELAKARQRKEAKRAEVQKFINFALGIDVLIAALVPLIFLRGLSRRLNVLISNAKKLPTEADLDRTVGGGDEIAFLNDVLCTAKDTISETEERRQLLVDMISHDVRMPLASATLLVHELQQNTEGQNVPRVQKLQRIFKRISLLVSDMLEMDKIEIGSVELDLQAVDIAEVIGTSLETVRPQAALRGIKIEGKLNSREVVIDPSRIGQVLDNLIGNAVKHSPDNSTVEVSTNLSEAGISIAITDQGAGIASGDLQGIFKRRFQTTDGRAKGGYGLGLFICKQLIEMHHGEINVTNLKPKGCRFTIFLPDDGGDFEDTAG